VKQTCIAHNRGDDTEDRSVLLNDAVNYKDYVASVACEWSIGGMLLTGEEAPVAVPRGPPVARTRQHASRVCVSGHDTWFWFVSESEVLR
jgi:hypothetical protein